MRVAFLLLIFTVVALAGGPGSGRRCTGKDPCPICRDCSACWYCHRDNPKRGSCGCCRDQSGAEAEKRESKRKKRLPSAPPNPKTKAL